MKKQVLLLMLAAITINSCTKDKSLPASTNTNSALLRETNDDDNESSDRHARKLTGSMLYNINNNMNLPCNCGNFAPAGTFSGSGTISHLGLTTSNIKACFAPIFAGQPGASPVIGLYTGHECASFVAANNDEVYLDTHPYNLMFTPAGAVGNVTIDIVGGTGRFNNASGSFTAIVTVNNANTVGTLNDINGTIVY